MSLGPKNPERRIRKREERDAKETERREYNEEMREIVENDRPGGRGRERSVPGTDFSWKPGIDAE